MAPRPCRVARARRETADTVTLELEPWPAGGPGAAAERFRFLPGQFNMLYLFGAGEVPISIAGCHRKTGRIVHTIRGVGALSRGLCALGRGEVLGLRGPFGAGWPVAGQEGRDVIVLSGGIGLAPLRPVILHLLENRRRYGRVSVLHGARTPADLIYRKELERWWRGTKIRSLVTVDHAGPEWRGDVGVVTTLVARAQVDFARAVAFVCGPEVMMRYAVRELRERGVDPARIHVSLERNMKCAIGFCGHCQLGPEFLCKDGPVFPYPRVARLLDVREL